LLTLILGFTSIATQIVVLRELLSIFYGNELIIGIILTNWMLLTGLGAYWGKKSDKIRNSNSFLIIFFTLISILPFILIFLAYYLRSIVFVYGTMVNIFEIFYSSFLLLLPFCILTGFLFTLLTHVVSNLKKENYISRVYSWESTGSIIGGILFNLVLFWFLNTFNTLMVLGIINLSAILFILFMQKKRWLFGMVTIILLGFISINITTNFDKLTRKYLYKNQDIQYFKSTPYGNITVAEQEGQINFYENNLLLFSSQQPVKSEETVHFPLTQVDNPEKILLLSGGMAGVVEEIKKYKPEQIDYVEINPWLIKAEKKFLPSENLKNLKIINKDARYYIEHTEKKYDAVIINLPEPSTAQINRFYTREFYAALKNRLHKNAVISFNLSGSSNYLSEETRDLYSSVYNTLKETFKNIIIVPGNTNFFLASDKELTYSITKKIQQKNIRTQYVNKFYFDDKLVEKRGKKILDILKKDIRINTDYMPVTYYLKLNQWASSLEFNYWIPFAVLILLSLVFVVRLNPVNFAMFAGGFAGASIEVVLLIAFQVLYGYVYNLVGIIVTVFMAGLAAGTYFRPKIISKVTLKNFRLLQLAIGIYSLLLPLLLLLFKSVNVPVIPMHAAFILMMFIISFMVGMLFSMASSLQLKKVAAIASGVYSVDLLGAALGSFIMTAYLIPALGLLNVCFIVGGLNLLGVLITQLTMGHS